MSNMKKWSPSPEATLTFHHPEGDLSTFHRDAHCPFLLVQCRNEELNVVTTQLQVKIDDVTGLPCPKCAPSDPKETLQQLKQYWADLYEFVAVTSPINPKYAAAWYKHDLTRVQIREGKFGGMTTSYDIKNMESLSQTLLNSTPTLTDVDIFRLAVLQNISFEVASAKILDCPAYSEAAPDSESDPSRILADVLYEQLSAGVDPHLVSLALVAVVAHSNWAPRPSGVNTPLPFTKELISWAEMVVRKVQHEVEREVASSNWSWVALLPSTDRNALTHASLKSLKKEEMLLLSHYVDTTLWFEAGINTTQVVKVPTSLAKTLKRTAHQPGVTAAVLDTDTPGLPKAVARLANTVEPEELFVTARGILN